MDQLRKLVNSLSAGQRIGIVVAVICLIGGISGFVHWSHESDFRPLFTGMPAEDAAAIVQKLKESGTEHRLADNGTSVLVPAAKVDELRIELAGAGLPRTGRIGFELFDKTNLGITDFAEHINYRRALEGELERSIRSLSEVEQARVHVSFPKDSVFLDAREPAKASVLVTLRPGARLSEGNVLAITNLLASAVEGLSPEFVSVVDMKGNLLSHPKKISPDGADPSDAELEYKHQVEKDLMAKVESTLAPLLGEDKFRVGISADCDFTTSEQTDEMFDPTRSVMSTSQKSEDLAGSSQPSGVPGTPSNLPRSTVRPVSSGSNVSRRTENVAYETSRTVRQVKVPRGAVKRISASLLLDQEIRWEGTGAKRRPVPVPLAPEKLKAIHDVVAGIIGLTPARGDQLIVENLPFEKDQELASDASLPAKPAGDAAAKWWTNPKFLLGAGGAALLLIVVLAVGLMRKPKQVEVARTPSALAAAAAAREESEAVAGSGANKQIEERIQPQISPVAERVEKLRQHLRDSVSKDPSLAANVIRGWADEAEG